MQTITDYPIDPLGPPLPARTQRRGKCGQYILRRLQTVELHDKVLDTPERAADFWRQHIETVGYFNHEQETFAVMLLNCRRFITGFSIVSQGTLDTLLVHPREVFRVPVICSAAAVILAHNHPSGDPTPSDADIKVTRDLYRAGELLKIQVLDHVVIGTATAERSKGFSSLRELGYFWQQS